MKQRMQQQARSGVRNYRITLRGTCDETEDATLVIYILLTRT